MVDLGMKNLKPLQISFLSFFVFNCLSAGLQGQQIQVSSPAIISLTPNYVSSECTLSQSSANGNTLLATVLVADPSNATPSYHTKVWQSQDRGQSWQDQHYPALPQAADPWGLQLASGASLIADISEGRKFHLQVSHFDATSQKWAAPNSFGYGFDHCMLLPGLDSQSVYLIATQKIKGDQQQYQTRVLIAHSRDGGRSFPKRHFHPVVKGLEFNAKQAYLHPNSTLMIPITLRGYFFEKRESPLPFAQMQSWLYPFFDHGATPGTPSFMTNLSGRKHHWLISNRQDPEHLYFAFTDADQQRLGLIQSHNGGSTWTAPIWIHQDSTSKKSVDLSAMAINARQEVAISWAKKVGESCYQRMISLLYHEAKQVQSREIGQLACPTDANGWIKNAWPQGGDYCGLTATSDDGFNLLYSFPLNGLFTPHFRQITIIR